MGEAKRKKLAGYVPEPVTELQKKAIVVGPYGRRSSRSDVTMLMMAMAMRTQSSISNEMRGIY